MSVRPIRAFLGASLLLALGACGDDSSGSNGPSAGTTFPASMVETYGSTGALLGEYAGSAFDFGGTNIGLAAPITSAANPRSPQAVIARVMTLAMAQQGATFSAAFLSSPSCTPTITGGASDTDGDGIPNDMVVEFTSANCTVTDTATGDVSVQRGTIRYRDTSDDLYGFDITVTDLRYSNYNGTSHAWMNQTVTAHESARTTTSGGTWALKFAATIRQGTQDTVSYDQVGAYDVKGTYTSNGVVPAGGPIPDGTISLSGTIDATLPTVGRLVVSLVTTTALHWESSCPAVDSGKLELRLNGQSDEGVLVRWLSCGYSQYEFLGSGVL